MKFAYVINGAGIFPKLYPNLGNLDVPVYRDHHRITEQELRKIQLLQPNSDSSREFEEFLDSFENQKNFKIKKVDLGFSHLIIYSDAFPKVFAR